MIYDIAGPGLHPFPQITTRSPPHWTAPSYSLILTHLSHRPPPSNEVWTISTLYPIDADPITLECHKGPQQLTFKDSPLQTTPEVDFLSILPITPSGLAQEASADVRTPLQFSQPRERNEMQDLPILSELTPLLETGGSVKLGLQSSSFSDAFDDGGAVINKRGPHGYINKAVTFLSKAFYGQSLLVICNWEEFESLFGYRCFVSESHSRTS